MSTLLNYRVAKQPTFSVKKTIARRFRGRRKRQVCRGRLQSAENKSKERTENRWPGPVVKILFIHKYGKSSVWDRENWIKFAQSDEIEKKSKTIKFSKTAVEI